MKRLLVLTFSAVAIGASASFELVMVLDRGDGSNPTRIHRIDGATGTYLGSFGTGMTSSPSNLAADPTTGTAFVSSGSIQTNFNYNTGLVNGYGDMAFAGNGLVYDPATKRLVLPDFNGLYHYNPTGSNGSTPNGISDTILWVARRTDGRWYAGGSSRNVYTLTGIMSSYSSIGMNGAGVVPAGWTRAAVGKNTIGNTQILAIANPGASNVVISHNLTGGGLLASATTVSITSMSSIIGVYQSHHGFFVVGKDTGGASALQYLHPNLALGQKYTFSQIISPRDIFVVNAPEPSGLAAAAIGIGALALRRRRRTN